MDGAGWALGTISRNAAHRSPPRFSPPRLRTSSSGAGAVTRPLGPTGPTGAAGTAEGGRVTVASPASPSLTVSLHQLPYEPHEFGGLERLGEEGVDADTEPGLDLVLRTGTHDREGQITGPRIGTEAGGGPQPVEPGHDDIKGDDIGAYLMNDIQTLGTVSRGHDLETLQLEVDPDQLPDDLVVVHNKHPAGRAWHNSRVGRHPRPRPAFPHFPSSGAATPLPRHPQNLFMGTLKELVGFYPSQRNAPDTPP